MTEYTKAKTPAKDIRVHGPELDGIVLKTMERIARIVGSTLGPGGRPVLIERQDFGMAPLVTKDGVTVFRSLGFGSAIEHVVMESTRDAAVRTVTEAGDGTTTATVLAYAVVKHMQEFCAANPQQSPQRVLRAIQAAFDKVIEPSVRKMAKKVNFSTRSGKRLLKSVATISANGDTALADAVMRAFDLVGDQGTVTITEKAGPAEYRVERIEGFPIPVGYEDSLGKFLSAFINDAALNRVYLRNPYFLLFNGTIADVQNLMGVLNVLQAAWMNRPGTPQHDPSQAYLESPNIVLVANGFTEQVVGTLALNMPEATSINVVPMVTPRSIIQNGEVHFLEDLAAITGAAVFNPLTKPFDSMQADLSELGTVRTYDQEGNQVGDGEFEMFRFRSTVIGRNDADEILERAEAVEAQAANAASELDARIVRERLGALTGGIAKLIVVSPSNGEIRERKDRADDAVRAVQGALKAGVLPGGGWTLLKLAQTLKAEYQVASPEVNVLARAFQTPVLVLLLNAGLSLDEADAVIERIEQAAVTTPDLFITYDAADHKEVEAFRAGLLDSTPAVLEAIRNSVSIAALNGALGGIVAYPRDVEFERREASANRDYERQASTPNEANERW